MSRAPVDAPAAEAAPVLGEEVLRERGPWRARTRTVVLVALQVLLVAAVVLPLLWMLSVSLKPEAEPFRIPVQLWPESPTLDNYLASLERPEFRRYFLNSVIVSVATILLAVTAALLAAYAVSRFRIRGARTILVLIIAGQMFPAATLIIPIFEFVRILGMINTYVALVAAYLTITVPVATWMILGFIQRIPREVEEAALVDGAGRLQAFWHVAIPAARPGIAATAVWIAVVIWQELLFALSLTTSDDMRTLAVGMNDFIGQYGIRYGEMMAGAVIMSIPVIVLFGILQRQFIAGITAGATKG